MVSPNLDWQAEDHISLSPTATYHLAFDYIQIKTYNKTTGEIEL